MYTIKLKMRTKRNFVPCSKKSINITFEGKATCRLHRKSPKESPIILSPGQTYWALFYHKWASTSILMSAISDIDIFYSDIRRKYVGLEKLSFRYQKSSDIDIRVHSETLYQNILYFTCRDRTEGPSSHGRAHYISATVLINEQF